MAEKKQPKVYLIGSLKNKKIVKLRNRLAKLGLNVFIEWHSPGPRADDYLREDEMAMGRGFKQALEESPAIDHIFNFDKQHLLTSDIAILVLRAGKSGHLELGWFLGIAYIKKILKKICKKLKWTKLPMPNRGYILLENPKPPRWDIMYKFADAVFENYKQLEEQLLKDKKEFEK